MGEPESVERANGTTKKGERWTPDQEEQEIEKNKIPPNPPLKKGGDNLKNKILSRRDRRRLDQERQKIRAASIGNPPSEMELLRRASARAGIPIEDALHDIELEDS